MAVSRPKGRGHVVHLKRPGKLCKPPCRVPFEVRLHGFRKRVGRGHVGVPRGKRAEEGRINRCAFRERRPRTARALRKPRGGFGEPQSARR